MYRPDDLSEFKIGLFFFKPLFNTANIYKNILYICCVQTMHVIVAKKSDSSVDSITQYIFYTTYFYPV